jgi:hypothetical protein
MSEKKKGLLHVEYYSGTMKSLPNRDEYGVYYKEISPGKYAVWAQKTSILAIPGSARMATLKKIEENTQE